jgi:hypothetical protein
VIRYRIHALSLIRSDNVQSLSIESYAHMHQNCPKEHGRAEYLALKLFVRGRNILARIGKKQDKNKLHAV